MGRGIPSSLALTAACRQAYATKEEQALSLSYGFWYTSQTVEANLQHAFFLVYYKKWSWQTSGKIQECSQIMANRCHHQITCQDHVGQVDTSVSPAITNSSGVSTCVLPRNAKTHILQSRRNMIRLIMVTNDNKISMEDVYTHLVSTSTSQHKTA